MNSLLENIWINASSFEDFKSSIEKQGYRVTAETYLRQRFKEDHTVKSVNVHAGIEYVPSHPSHPTIRELRSQV